MRSAGLIALSAACLLALGGCGKEHAKRPKMASVKLLPDTPPPPPPPPKLEEKKPEPPKEDKPQQQPDQPKPAEAPAPQALKSDEAAGDGPGNGMSAGSVSQDYKAGQIGSGAGGGGNTLAINSYAGAVTRSLNDFLARDKDVKRHDYKVQVRVWLEADGRLLRAELIDTTGDAEMDAALKTALSHFPGLKTALPDGMPQPLRLKVANRMIG